MKQANQRWCHADNRAPNANPASRGSSLPRTSGKKLLLATAVALSLAQLPAQAASGDWINNGSGTWSDPTMWSNGTVPGTAGTDVVGLNYAITAPVTVTIDGTSQTNGTLNIGSPSTAFPYTLQAINGGKLSFYNNNANAYLLQQTSTSTDEISAPLYLADGVVVTNNSTLVLSGVISGAGNKGMTKWGNGTLKLTATNTFNGNFHVRGGTVVLEGVVNTAGNYDSIGMSGTDYATLTIQGNGSLQSTADFNVADVGTSTGVLNISSTNATAALSVNMMIVSSANAGGAATTGTVYQTAGTVKVNGTADNFMIGGRNSGSNLGVGTYNLSGGSVVVAGNAQFGVYGTGSLNMVGGTFDVGGWPSIGRQANGAGYLNINGGTFNQNGTGNRLMVGEGGRGILTVGGTGVVNCKGSELTLGNNVGVAVTNMVNLNPGGTINAKAVRSTATNGIFNFNGGTLRATASSTTFMRNLIQVNLNAPASVIDTDTNSITILPNMTGLGGLTKNGNGQLILAGTNTYAGATTVNAGELLGLTGGSSVSSVTIAAGATNGVQVNSVAGQYKSGSLTFNAGSSLDFVFNAAPSLSTAPLLVNGNITINGAINATLSSSARLFSGTYPLLKYTGTLSGSLPGTILLPANVVGTLSHDAANKTLFLTISSYPVYIDLAGTAIAAPGANTKDITVTVSANATLDSDYSITLMSGNTGVVANKTVVIPQGSTTATFAFPILGVGAATVTTSSGGNAAPVSMQVVGKLPVITFNPKAVLSTVGSTTPVTLSLVTEGATVAGPYTINLVSDNLAVTTNQTVTLGAGVATATVNFPVLKTGSALVTASATNLLPSTILVGSLDIGLFGQWVADDYVSGNSWTDRVSNVIAPTDTGSVKPISVASAFGTHSGVQRNPVGGNSGFSIPKGTPPNGLTNFTVAVAFRATGPGNTGGGGYYADQLIIGYDIGGGGQPDWGISWGGGAAWGQTVTAGVGVSGGDRGFQTAPPLATYATHAAVLQVSNNMAALYLDGAQISKATGITPLTYTNNVNGSGIIPLLSTINANIGGVFTGMVAEVRIYTNGLVDAVTLSDSLRKFYGVADITLPVQQGLVINQPSTLTVSVQAQYTPCVISLTATNTTLLTANSWTVSLPKGVTSTNISIMATNGGSTYVVATSPGLVPARALLAAVSDAGMALKWVANDYNGSGVWTDRISGVSALADNTGGVNPVLVRNAFGTNSAVARGTTADNGDGGFSIPAGTPPFGLTSFTIAVVFKPLLTGPTDTAGYWNQEGIIGYDLGGGGRTDFGLAWGGVNGSQITASVGQTTGNDSAIASAINNYALNQTHAAVFQVNGTAKTSALYVDGLPVANLTGVSPQAPTNSDNAGHTLPFLSTVDANMGHAFRGQIAELRIYTNAVVDGPALSSLLLNTYQGDPLIDLTVAPAAVDVNETVTFTITVPATATSSAAKTVTLTSDNLAVVDNISVVLPVGVATTNVSARVLSVGTANVVASGAQLARSGTVTINGLAARSLLESFKAAETGLSDGQEAPDWYSTPGMYDAVYQWINAPKFVDGPIKSLLFGGQDLRYSALNYASDILADRNNFSIVTVIKANSVGTNSGSFTDMAAIINHGSDYGLALNGSGQFAWGTGNPNNTMLVTNYGAVDGLFHVVVATYDGYNGIKTLTLDDQPPVIVTNVVATAPRAVGYTFFGAKDGGANPVDANIAEITFYNGAFKTNEAASLVNSLKTAYGIKWRSEAVCTIDADYSSGVIGDKINFQVGIPAAANKTAPVTVTLNNTNPAVLVVPVSLTFAAGATNVQTFTSVVLTNGTTAITTASAGYSSATKTINGRMATLVESFTASSIAQANNSQVNTWVGDKGVATAYPTNNPPTYLTASTPNGKPAVVFSNNMALYVPAGSNPFGGQGAFTLALVFKPKATGTQTSGNWYNQMGLIDAEEANTVNDWGVTFDASGRVNFGVGNPDRTLPDLNNVADTNYHIAVLSWDGSRARMTINVDNQLQQIMPSDTTVGTAARNNAPIRIGFGGSGSYFNGEIAEIDFYNDFTLSNNVPALVNTLKTRYGVVFQDASVVLTSPTNNASYYVADSIPLAATTVSPGYFVDKVQFFAGSTLVGEATNAPYAATWTNLTVGTYSLTAKMIYGGNMTNVSAPISVTVKALPPIPVITVTGPTNGANFMAPATVELDAIINADAYWQITNVVFYRNGTSAIQTLTTAPYAYVWPGLPVGSYTVTAKANYNGGTVTSAPITFTVGSPVVNVLLAPLGSGAFRMTWSSGTLLQSTNVNGPWVTNNATSPFTNTPSLSVPQMFYRVRVQ